MIGVRRPDRSFSRVHVAATAGGDRVFVCVLTRQRAVFKRVDARAERKRRQPAQSVHSGRRIDAVRRAHADLGRNHSQHSSDSRFCETGLASPSRDRGRPRVLHRFLGFQTAQPRTARSADHACDVSHEPAHRRDRPGFRKANRFACLVSAGRSVRGLASEHAARVFAAWAAKRLFWTSKRIGGIHAAS